MIRTNPLAGRPRSTLSDHAGSLGRRRSELGKHALWAISDRPEMIANPDHKIRSASYLPATFYRIYRYCIMFVLLFILDTIFGALLASVPPTAESGEKKGGTNVISP